MAQSSSSGIPMDVEEAVRNAGYTITSESVASSPSQLSFPSKQVVANTTSSPTRRIVKTVTQSTTSLPRSVIVTHVEGDNASSIHELQQEIQSIRSRTFSGQSGASVLSAQLGNANANAISSGIYGWSSTTSFVDNANEGQRSVVSLAVPHSAAGKVHSVTSSSVANLSDLVADESGNVALPGGFIRKHTISTTSSRVETKSLAPSHTSSTRYSVVVSGGDAPARPAGNKIMQRQVFSTSSRSLVSVTSQTSRVVVNGSSSQAGGSAVISGQEGGHCSTTDLVSTQGRVRYDSVESAPSDLDNAENAVIVSKDGQNGNLFVTKNISGMKSTTSVITTTSVKSYGANQSTTNVVSTSQGRSRHVSTSSVESAPEEIVSADANKAANNSSCVNVTQERSRRDSVESAPSELGEHVQDVAVVPSKRQSTNSTKAPVKRSSYIAPPERSYTPHRSATATPTQERTRHTRSGSAESAPSDLDHIPDSAPKPSKRQSVLSAKAPSKRPSYIAPTPRSNTPQRSATATPTQAHSYPVRSESPESAPSDLDHVSDVALGSKNPYKRTSVNAGAPKTNTESGADDTYSTNIRGGFGIHRSNTVDDAANRNVSRRDSTDSAESAPSELDHAQGVPVTTSRPPSKRQSLAPAPETKDMYGRRSPQRSATSVVPPEPCHEKSDSIHSAPSELDHAQAGAAYGGNKSDRRVSRVPVPVVTSDPPVRGYSIDSVKSPFEDHCEPQPASTKPSAEPTSSDQPRYVPFAYERAQPEPPVVDAKNIPPKPAVAPVKHGRTASMESIDLAPSRPNPPKRTMTLDPTCEEPPTRRSTESARSAPSQLGHGAPPAVPYVWEQRLPPSAPGVFGGKSKPRKARRSHKSKCWINLIILLAYIAGAVFALGHHLFLASIHQKDVMYYSQFWVKNLSNAFSQAVSITLGFAVTLCITEGVWKAIRACKTDSEVTSDLFALPSGTSIFAFLKRRWKFTWIILVFLAVVYNLLAFVSMFAPNALSVGPRDIISDVPVPNLNLSAVPAESGSNGWSRLMRHQITTSVADNWNVPALCGTSCSFDIEYKAPGLSCRDLRQDEITIQAYDSALVNSASGWIFYDAPYQLQTSLEWGRDDLNFSLSYAPMIMLTTDFIPVTVTQSGTLAGQFCQFEDKSYRASFSYAQNQRFVSTAPVSSDASGCNWSDGSLSQDCEKYGTNAVGFVSGFAAPLSGSLVWTAAGIINNVSGLYEFQDIIEFSNDTTTNTISLMVTVPNLGASLEELFANATLGAMLSFDQTQISGITIQEGNAWIYDRQTLWYIYAPALALVFLCILYGLYCSWNNPIEMKRGFIDLLLAIRSDQKEVKNASTAAVNRVQRRPLFTQQSSTTLAGSTAPNKQAETPSEHPDSKSNGILENNLSGYLSDDSLPDTQDRNNGQKRGTATKEQSGQPATRESNSGWLSSLLNRRSTEADSKAKKTTDAPTNPPSQTENRNTSNNPLYSLPTIQPTQPAQSTPTPNEAAEKDDSWLGSLIQTSSQPKAAEETKETKATTQPAEKPKIYYMINPDAPSDSSEVPPEITLPSNILGRFGNTTEDKTAQPAGSCHTPASEPPKASSNAPPKQADSTGDKTGLDWAAPFLADPAQQPRTTNSSEANRSAKPVESSPRNRYDSTATAAPTVNSHASRPSNGRIYNHGNGTEASILGNRKPFSVKFRDEPAPERPNHERATSDDIVTFKPAQQADSMYSRMSEKDWNRSEASVNTHTDRTNGTYTHSNEALVKGEDGKTQKKNDSKKPTLKQRINDLWTEIMMVGSWLLALLFAIGHHLFFSHIDTTLAGSAQSQFWVRNAGNAFAHFAVIFLGIAVSTSLIQACWRAIKLMGIRLKTVDNMFSLPSPKAIKELLKGIKFKHALYLILIVILMKGLILVSILAPNSLTIGFAESTPVALVVPSLSFGAPLYSAHVAVWDDMVNQAIVTPPEDDWDVPAGCGTECSFDVEYQAPALSCQDLSATEFTLVPYESANTTESGVQWTYYQTLSTSTQTQWNGQNDSPFLCNYKPMTLREVSGDYRVNYTLPHVGASCFCQDATYRTTFKFANNRKTVETNLVSYGGSSDCAWSDPSSLSPECQNYATNSLQICKSFMHSFSGTIEWRANHTEINVPSPLVLDKIVLLDSDINGDGIVSLTPRFTNLSQGLVSMFANMTANLVPGLGDNSTANEVAWDGAGIWDYSAVTLWAIYSPVFLSSLVILFYAFYCIHKNGRALDNKFTTLILVAQTEAMNDINEIAAQHSDEQTEKENDPEKGDGYFELNNL